MVPAEQNLEVARERGSGPDRPMGPIHALPRRNGARRRRQGEVSTVAADRRSHHQPRAHRRQDRPSLCAASAAWRLTASHVIGVVGSLKIPSFPPPSPTKIVASRPARHPAQSPAGRAAAHLGRRAPPPPAARLEHLHAARAVLSPACVPGICATRFGLLID